MGRGSSGGGNGGREAGRIVGQYEISAARDSRQKIVSFYQWANDNNGIRLNDGRIQITRTANERATELANQLANRVEMQDTDAREAYRDIRRMLSGRYYLSEQDRRDISDSGAYLRGSLVRVTKNRQATSLDSAYQQLSSRFPQYFSRGVTHPADQLRTINDTMRSLRDGTVRLGDRERREIADDLRREIIGGYARSRRRRAS